MREGAEQRGSRLATAAGLAVIAGLALADALTGERVILVPLLVAGPLIAASAASVRDVTIVAGAAVAAAIALGLADDNFAAGNHMVDVAAVALGSALAVLVAEARQRPERALVGERSARRHADFLASAGALLELPLDPEAHLERLVRLAVPDMADLCTVDLVDGGDELRGAVTYAADRDRHELLRASRERYPIAAGGEHPVAVAARSGRAELIPSLTDAQLDAAAQDPEHRRLIVALRYSTAIVAPLVVEGRVLGVLSLLRCESDATPYDEADLAVAKDVARRAALGLANARLYRDLASTEGQLEAILRGLAEAVLVHDAARRVVYGNEAAARLVSGGGAAELVGREVDQLLTERFTILDAEGAPFDLAQAPGRRVLAGERPEPALVRLVARDDGEERWIVMKATPVEGAGGTPALAVDVLEDVTDLRRAERRERFLSRASALVASSLDVAATLDKVAWSVVPEVADFCRVDLPDERGRLRQVALAHADAERRQWLEDLRERYPTQPGVPGTPRAVAESGEALLAQIDDDLRAAHAHDEAHLELLRRIGARSVIVAPMRAGNRVIGTITMGTDQSDRRLTEDDLELAVDLGRRAGIAIENAHIHAARSFIATTLQRSLLPPRLPVVPGLTIAARFRAAGETTEVGGDFYDLFPTDDAWVVVMGDVTGKGPGAAAITSLARFTMRTAAAYEASPARILDRLNRTLVGDNDARQLCTAVCVRVEAGRDGQVRLSVACGGHPPPLLLRADGRVEAAGTPGPLLGAFEHAAWQEVTVTLDEGQSVVLFTDGVTDARGEDDRFGQVRLEAALTEVAGRDADEVAGHVDDRVQEFEVGAQRDDVALLVLRASGSATGEASLVAEGIADAAHVLDPARAAG